MIGVIENDRYSTERDAKMELIRYICAYFRMKSEERGDGEHEAITNTNTADGRMQIKNVFAGIEINSPYMNG